MLNVAHVTETGCGHSSVPWFYHCSHQINWTKPLTVPIALFCDHELEVLTGTVSNRHFFVYLISFFISAAVDFMPLLFSGIGLQYFWYWQRMHRCSATYRLAGLAKSMDFDVTTVYSSERTYPYPSSIRCNLLTTSVLVCCSPRRIAVGRRDHQHVT